MDHIGLHWITLEYFRTLSNTLDYFGLLWITLDYFGLLWIAIQIFGLYNLILDCVIQNLDLHVNYMWVTRITLDYLIQNFSVVPFVFEQFILLPLWHKKGSGLRWSCLFQSLHLTKNLISFLSYKMLSLCCKNKFYS